MNYFQLTIKFTLQHSSQQISFIDLKIHIRAYPKLCKVLYRNPTDCVALLQFHSNHLLKCKRSIVLQALRHNLFVADDNLLQKELDSLTMSLLSRNYPLDINTHNIPKAFLHSHHNLLNKTIKTSSPRTVLLIVTLCSIEGKRFFQAKQDGWYIIENDS